ncbi:hypothetical protein EBR78_06405 [bacterium]|nr:hypothetical protein [bacterium]
MFVKKYEVESLEEGLKQIRKELGPQALILGTQKKKSGLLGKTLIEITVAYEQKEEKKPQTLDPKMLEKVFPHRKTGVVHGQEKTERKTASRASKYVEILDEPSGRTGLSPKPVRRNPFEIEFIRLGISPAMSKELGLKLLRDYPEAPEDGVSSEKFKCEVLGQRLKTMDWNDLQAHSNWALVGTAGVGKTTSVVKLALMLKQQRKQVSMSSLDNRKVVSGIEMNQYSRMLRVPLKKFDEARGQGINLVDTPSLRLDHPDSNWSLVKKLETVPTSIFLCLEGSLRFAEMMRTIDYAQTLFPIKAIFITKMDLVTQAGFLVDLVQQSRLPICALSQSQSLQELIKLPTPRSLSQIVLHRGETP